MKEKRDSAPLLLAVRRVQKVEVHWKTLVSKHCNMTSTPKVTERLKHNQIDRGKTTLEKGPRVQGQKLELSQVRRNKKLLSSYGLDMGGGPHSGNVRSGLGT